MPCDLFFCSKRPPAMPWSTRWGACASMDDTRVTLWVTLWGAHVCFCICELRAVFCDGDLSRPGALGLGTWDLFYMSDLSQGERYAAPEASFTVVEAFFLLGQ